MKTLNINFDTQNKIDSVIYGKEIYRKDIENNQCYFEVGSYCIFISKKNWKYGLKFYLIKNILYPLNVIENIFEIYQLLYDYQWGTKAISIFEFKYENIINWGIKVEKAEFSKSGKFIFDKNEFRTFCLSIKGLRKVEPNFDDTYGKDWLTFHPELQFYVGNRNLKRTNSGKTVLIDIDPRWSLIKK